MLERHYAAGGFTHVFHMFDYLTEGRLDWQPSPMSTIASLSAICVSPTDGESRLRDELKAAFSAESRAIDRYFAAIHRARRL